MVHNGGYQSVLSGSDDVQRLEGRDAQSANFAAGKALSETIKTTLGPNGLDKLLVTSDGHVVVTNDGASIVDRMEITHPAAQSIVDVAERQQSRVGDGTTSAIVLAGELLANAEGLLEDGVHQTTVTRGYARAAERALDALDEQTTTVDPTDEDQLRDVAKTVITGKWDERASTFLAAKAVDVVLAIEQDGAIDAAKITRKAIPGSSYYDSEVVDGLVIDMNTSSTTSVSPEPGPPDAIADATVALIDGQLTIETATGQGAVSVESPEDLHAFREYEEDVYETHVRRIVDAGADVVFCQKSIDDRVRYLLAREGVLAIERTRQDELEKLGRATGARPVGTIDDLTPEATGRARRVERRDVGTTELAVVEGRDDVEQVSLVLRGGTQHVADETKRVIDDCLRVLTCAIEDGVVVPGGGAAEIHVARDLREFASSVSDREQLAVEAFADAIEVIPRILAESSGLNPIDAVVELRARHYDGNRTAGLALESGTIDDAVARGVVEPLAVKKQAIASATEAANTLVRVDEVVSVTRDGAAHADDEHDHDHAGGLVESTEGYPWAVGHSMGH